MRVRACVRARVRACACVRVCVCALCVYVCVRGGIGGARSREGGRVYGRRRPGHGSGDFSSAAVSCTTAGRAGKTEMVTK